MQPFDQQIRAAMCKLGFTISDDGGEIAKIADKMTVEIIWPDEWCEDYLLMIELPNGVKMDGTIWRHQLLNAAGIEGDEAA